MGSPDPDLALRFPARPLWMGENTSRRSRLAVRRMCSFKDDTGNVTIPGGGGGGGGAARAPPPPPGGGGGGVPPRGGPRLGFQENGTFRRPDEAVALREEQQ